MKIGYVCTNVNNSSYTREAVRSLFANGAHDYRVVIVDNRSRPESVRELIAMQEEFPSIDLILNEENVGYFRGLNVGLRRLRAAHPDLQHVVVGNNDLVFPANFVRSVESCSATFDAHAVVSPDIVTVDGVHQNPHVIARVGKVREVMYDLYHSSYLLALLIKKGARLTRRFTSRHDQANWQTAQPIYSGHGSCYILGPVFFRHFDELWAPTFLLAEEYFLSKQLRDKGLHVYYEPAIAVVHHWHATLDQVPSRKVWAMSRDAHRVYRKYVKIFR